jgi:peptidoglycan/LPS O-acetylase OafA/YrhL
MLLAGESLATPLPRRLPGIDALRAIASMAVAAAHVVQAGLPAQFASNRIWVTMGSFGVGLFFVISGFCIHAPLVRRELEGRDAGIDYRAFFKRRFLRLYPAHLGALLLSIAAAAFIATPSGAVSLVSVTTPGQFVAHVLMVHTFFKTAYFSGNAVLWTLAIETHFYLAYPLFLALRRRFGTARVVVALLVLSLALNVAARFTGSALDVVLSSALPRWWEWVLGCLVVELVLSRGPRFSVGYLALTMTAIAALAVGVALSLLPGGSFTLTFALPIVFAAVVVAGAWTSPTGARALPNALVAVGRASYSLYLVHPIAYHVACAALFAAGAGSVTLALGLAASAVIATVAYYVTVERPLMNRAAAEGEARGGVAMPSRRPRIAQG